MTTYDKSQTPLERAKQLETEDSPVAVRGFAGKIMLAQDSVLIALDRRDAKRVLREIEILLNQGKP
jgi:hypothetical protein